VTMVTDPSDLSPRQAVNRYLDRRRSELTDSTIQSYRYRLKLWMEWCEEEGIESVSELSGWVFEQFEAHRSGKDLAPQTINGEMKTLKGHVEYLERIGAVEDDLAEKIHIPDVPQGERSRDERLSTDRARKLLRHYRTTEHSYGTRYHALLELLWHTGARIGGIRALDLRDFDADEGIVEFVHRPSTGTPLKNKLDGERMVGVREPVVDAVEAYIDRNRDDVQDEHGRSPLFTTQRAGRPSKNALRHWCYITTLPCRAEPCPHERNEATCEYRSYTHSSKCPSSMSPHKIRTGSISWHRDCGFPKEVTAERVNASEDVIDEFYDKSSKRERMKLRRRPHLHKLDIEDEQRDEDDDSDHTEA